jgi:1,4-alpha-glucan branching enzyme
MIFATSCVLHRAGISSLSTGYRPFSKDDFALRRFDGTATYDMRLRRGEHPDGALIQLWSARNAQLPRRQRVVLTAQYHVDGLRVDAVA